MGTQKTAPWLHNPTVKLTRPKIQENLNNLANKNVRDIAGNIFNKVHFLLFSFDDLQLIRARINIQVILQPAPIKAVAFCDEINFTKTRRGKKILIASKKEKENEIQL